MAPTSPPQAAQASTDKAATKPEPDATPTPALEPKAQAASAASAGAPGTEEPKDESDPRSRSPGLKSEIDWCGDAAAGTPPLPAEQPDADMDISIQPEPPREDLFLASYEEDA